MAAAHTHAQLCRQQDIWVWAWLHNTSAGCFGGAHVLSRSTCCTQTATFLQHDTHSLGVKVAHWEAHVFDANLLAALLNGVNVNVEVLHVTVLLGVV